VTWPAAATGEPLLAFWLLQYFQLDFTNLNDVTPFQWLVRPRRHNASVHVGAVCGIQVLDNLRTTFAANRRMLSRRPDSILGLKVNVDRLLVRPSDDVLSPE
jgi:hypothetical protein